MPEAIRDAEDPPDLGLRHRPSRPAQLSVADIADHQRRRARHDTHNKNGQRSPSRHGPEPSEAAPQRNVSGSTTGDAAGRLASLKRKFGRSKKAGGFLLEKVSSGDSRRSRLPTPEVVDHRPERNGDIANKDGSAQSRDVSFDAERSMSNGASSSQRSDASTPQSRNGRQHHYGATLQASAFGSPPSYRSPRGSSEQNSSSYTMGRNRASSASIDPTQLVRMALNLSESRRMQLDPGHLPSIAVPAETRHATPPQIGVASRRDAGSVNSRDRTPDDSSPLARPSTGSRSHASRVSDSPMMNSSPLSGSKTSIVLTADSQPEYIFSPSTLERTQKAKRYLELSAQYRRLLEHLPPLRPCLRPDGKKAAAEVGRPYNPLQYIRNRKARIEHNAELDSEADGWDEPAHVAEWVNTVESESQQPGFIADDIVLLPHWSSGKSKSTNPDSEDTKLRQQNLINGRKENRTKGFDWRFNPSDLIADAYWLEQEHHKSLIYSKQGSKIFHTLSQPIKAIQARRNRAATAHSNLSNESWQTDTTTSPQARRLQLNSSHGLSDLTSDEEDSALQSPEHHHGTNIMKKTFFRKRTRSNTGSSDESVTEASPREKNKSPSQRPRANIGPLEKHMQAMIEQEARNERPRAFSPPTSPANHAGKSRRLGISGESYQRPSDERRPDEVKDEFGGPLEVPQSTIDSPIPRISVESYDDDTARRMSIANSGASMTRTSTAQSSRTFQSDSKPKSSRIKLWQRPKSRPDSRIEVTDFAEGGLREGFNTPPYSSDVESGVDTGTTRPVMGGNPGRESVESDLGGYKSNEPADTSSRFGYSAARSRLFKGGRIGELVRNESSQIGNVVFKRPPPRGSSPEKSETARSSKASPETQVSRIGRPLPSDVDSGNESSKKGRRNSSADDSSSRGSPTYNIKNLPAFQSSKPSARERRGSNPQFVRDHISRQQEERRLQRLNSRLSSMTPSYIDTSDQESSSNALSRYNTREPPTTAERRGSYGFGRFSESAATGRAPEKRLSAITSEEPERRRGSLLEASSLPPPSPRLVRALSHSRQWSIGNTSAPKPKSKKAVVVTQRDVARTRSLLLSACIKAQAICNGAEMPRDEVNAFLRGAFEALGQDMSKLGRMSTRQAHVMAAQLLADRLSKILQDLDNEVVSFQTITCQRLIEQVDDLRERATSDLMPKIQSAGGEADAFVARLTTTHTLAIRQVMDSVEKMLRTRRRRLRYAQRQLFTMLEWSLVGLMWWIWLIVFVLRFFRAIVVGLYNTARWLLWL